ncbi:MAG: hypothetical protein IKJ18_01675 [Bacteroidaceae bacterium]|nr:hypothetical protein [Bacteroidaceae bacterium]
MQTTKRKNIANILIAFVLMLFIAMPASAQGIAEVWLGKATEKLQNKGTEISFRINEEGVRISGKLLMDGQKFIYDTEEMKIWYDGTTQWTLQMGSGYNELYINNPTPEEQQAINPYQLLSSYKDNFTATDGGEKNLNGKLAHMVKLQANDESAELGSINIYITNDGTLSLLELIAPDDRTYKIEVRSMRNGLTFPKDAFTYPAKDYPADEVIDLR